MMAGSMVEMPLFANLFIYKLFALLGFACIHSLELQLELTFTLALPYLQIAKPFKYKKSQTR
jgi:hypothetical protein